MEDYRWIGWALGAVLFFMYSVLKAKGVKVDIGKVLGSILWFLRGALAFVVFFIALGLSFSVLASIIHFQILGALAFTALAFAAWLAFLALYR